MGYTGYENLTEEELIVKLDKAKQAIYNIEREQCHRKEAAEKEMQKLKEKWAEEEYKRNNPHCTWMFNHFDFGNEWIYYKTLY